MRLVIALGGNALLRRGQAPTLAAQRQNVRAATRALAGLSRDHDLVITHGNGPQVGLLALQENSCNPQSPMPLDMLDAETEGMIGYLIEQELMNLLPAARTCATLLTQIEVAADDPAFDAPSKPIGPLYSGAKAEKLTTQRGWRMAPDGEHFRRVVPSPKPRRILELAVIQLLLDHGVIVICAGGGGIPTVRDGDNKLTGVEAVIDKDLASCLLAKEIQADMLLMLTDVAGVYLDWPAAAQPPVKAISPDALAGYDFAEGSMGPKVAAAMDFVRNTGGRAAIGALADGEKIITGRAGTLVSQEADGCLMWK